MTMQQTRLIYLTITLALASSGMAFQPQACTRSPGLNPESKDVTFNVIPCSEGDGSPASPCVFPQGSQVEFTVTFTPTYKYKKMYASLDWIDGDNVRNMVAFKSDQKNLCQSMQPRICPSPGTLGTSFSWSATVPWGNKPNGDYNLVFMIADPGTTIVCQKFSVTLK